MMVGGGCSMSSNLLVYKTYEDFGLGYFEASPDVALNL